MAKITQEMAEISYKIAKKVYTGELSLDEGRTILSAQHGMDTGSASDYIHNYKCLILGERYTRTMNEYATKYYLAKILVDNGINSLMKSLNAVWEHLEYHDTIGHNNLLVIKNVYYAFSELIEDDGETIAKCILQLS